MRRLVMADRPSILFLNEFALLAEEEEEEEEEGAFFDEDGLELGMLLDGLCVEGMGAGSLKRWPFSGAETVWEGLAMGFVATESALREPPPW
jgi:hypothetical protein